MLCTNCNSNPAQFHYKQITGGKKTELHLCASCAQSLGYISKAENFFDIGSILNDFISPGFNVKNPSSCLKCGTTFDDFRRTGFLGCEECYETFSGVIESSLSKIQPSTTHKGTLAGEEGKKIEKKNELESLKDELKKAIIDERYEDAAVLRDKIKKLEDKDNG